MDVRLSDFFRATLADNCGNTGFVGLARDGTEYHVVVPVDAQIARGVKAGLAAEDGTPFGGYRHFLYFECPPYPAGPEQDSNKTRWSHARVTARVFVDWAVKQGFEVNLVDDQPE